MIITLFLLFSQSAWADPAPQPSLVPPPPAGPSSSTRKLSTPIIPKRNGAYPVPKSTIPAGKRVEAKLKNPGAPFTINPKEEAVVEQPTRFQLSQGGNKLILSYHTKDPTLVLSLDNPLAIQISSDDPVEVEPAVITLENWPKKAQQMVINYKGKPVAGETQLTVHAAYYVCKTTTKQCSRARMKFTFPMTP